MLLAVDIGNTNLVFGVFDGSKLIASFRIATHHDFTEDEYGLIFDNLQVKGHKLKTLKVQ